MPDVASILHARAPPEQLAQFQWIVETVVERTNELRDSLCLISARSLFDPRPGPHTKSPRLLTVFLARDLMHWPASTINAVFSPTSYPHSANLPAQARQWVRSGRKPTDSANSDDNQRGTHARYTPQSLFSTLYARMGIMIAINPTADDIIATLRANEQALREQGIMRAALFGSRARGDNRPDSDIDIMIEIDPALHMDVYEYAGIKLAVEDLFPVQADVINRAFLKPSIRPVAERHLIYAF